MKQFFKVFKFEFLGVIKTKVYIIVSVLLILLAAFGLSFPRFFGEIDLGGTNDAIVDQVESDSKFALYDPNELLKGEEETLKLFFPEAEFVYEKDLDKLEKLVKKGTAEAGFYIKEDFNFVYYVNDSNMMDMTSVVFSEALSQVKRNYLFEEKGYDANEIMEIYYNSVAVGEIETLGSDGANNFAYTMFLIIIIYMVTIMYGQFVATSVATEKGNRTMEILVTSASPNALIFGKVIASALAAVLQVGIFIAVAFTFYTWNQELWGGMLDMFFNIPADVLGAFALFGAFGFLFYAFMFGALGALVSKTEDINGSMTPITVIFVAIYLVVYIGVMDAGSIIFKVASFVPLSSPMAMFARMAMVDVPLIEVIISFIILLVSTVLVGLGASKIYRRGTLMYGNPVKLRNALKWLKKSE